VNVHPIETQYLALLKELAFSRAANIREDRTGTGTFSLFGRTLRGPADGAQFPLLTTKRVHFKSVVHELLWMLRGETNTASLNVAGVTIWDEWADAHGYLGPIYGHQWRYWTVLDSITETGVKGRTFDQIREAQRLLREDPFSRRIIVSAWNVADLDKMALAPCHAFFQFYVRKDATGLARTYLDLQLYQRSADIFLGVPFNIASYALLINLMASVTGHHPGDLIIQFGDVHLYKNHAAAALEQLRRTPKEACDVELIPEHKPDNVWEYRPSDVVLTNYFPHPTIKAPVAV